MKPNTNKKTRAYVEGVLKNLGLALGDTNYRDHYETIQRHSAMRSSKEKVTKALIDINGCVTTSERDSLNSLNRNLSLESFLNTL